MTKSIARTLAVAAAMATVSFSIPAASAPTDVASPQWVSRPTAANIERFYPVKAKMAARNGKATMRCNVTATGAVDDCRLLSETPKPYGFGQSLLTMARLFKMKPQDASGKSLEGMDVTIQLSFYVK